MCTLGYTFCTSVHCRYATYLRSSLWRHISIFVWVRRSSQKILHTYLCIIPYILYTLWYWICAICSFQIHFLLSLAYNYLEQDLIKAPATYLASLILCASLDPWGEQDYLRVSSRVLFYLSYRHFPPFSTPYFHLYHFNHSTIWYSTFPAVHFSSSKLISIPDFANRWFQVVRLTVLESSPYPDILTSKVWAVFFKYNLP